MARGGSIFVWARCFFLGGRGSIYVRASMYMLAARREQVWLIGANPCSAGWNEVISRCLCSPGRDTAAEKRREGGPADDRSVFDPPEPHHTVLSIA